MNEPASKRIFVDNCIISVSETMQGAKKAETVNWGGSNHTVEIVGYERKPLPREDEVWKRQEVECLPTVGRVARQNIISLCEYQETILEGWKRPGSFHATAIGNVFEGVEIEQVEAAVERSYFFKMELGKYIEKKSMVEFCEWLLKIDPNTFIEKIAKVKEFPIFLLNNLQNVGRFKELCAGLSPQQYPDAFHLWTAEVNRAEYFLTIDRRFIRVMTETKRMQLSCHPLSPSQLLEILTIHERDPFQYEEGKFYDVFGRPG